MTLHPRIRSAYVDNDIISVYAAGPRNAQRFNELLHMINLARERRVRLITSTVTLEESGKGAESAIRQRAHALHTLHVRVTAEPAINVRNAESLLRKMSDRQQSARLLNDARHLLMAKRMGADVVVTSDISDFAMLQGLVSSAPLITNPAQLATILVEGIHPRTRSNPPRPVRKGSLRAFVLKRLHQLQKYRKGHNRY